MALTAQDLATRTTQGVASASGVRDVLDGVPLACLLLDSAEGHPTRCRALRSAPSTPRRALGRARGWCRSVAGAVRRWTRPRPAQVVRLCRADGECGMATAEYAIVMIAAVSFAGLLVVILRSSEIREVLTGLVRGALNV